MKYNKIKLLLFIWLCALTVTVSAQKVLEKPFQKWSKDEAVKILTDSPWVQTYQSNVGVANAESLQIARSQSQSTARGQQQKITGSSPNILGVAPVIIRLHSSLPIRQAMVRLQQIEVGYDKFDEKKRAAFDQATRNILECPLCKDYYVVTMTKFTNSSEQGVQEGLFQTMKPENLKGNVWLLNDKGEKRELREFTPPKSAGNFAIFFFPRRDEKNSELITANNKELKFVFSNDFLNSSNNAYSVLLPRSFDFKVSKLMVGDKVEF